MEWLLILLGLFIVLAPLVSIICSVTAFRRITAFKAQISREIRGLESNVRELKARLDERGAPPAWKPGKSAGRAGAAQAAHPGRDAVVPAGEEAGAPERERTAVPAAEVTAPIEDWPSTPVARELAARAGSPAPPPPPLRPPEPPKPQEPAPPPPPAPPPRPPFDWEAVLGLRGAAWAGAIAFAIAGTLFARYSFEHNLITPPLRVAVILLAGIGTLVGSELVLRKGYAITCSALCGAGIILLYTGFYAARAFYGLIPVLPAFCLMALVTVVAALLSIRHSSLFTAILGLLGGFATPILLSTGVDHPVGLFSYILLLDIGLLFISVRKGWNVLALLSLAATLLIEALWFGTHMAPEKMLVAVVVFFLFAALYMVLPLVAKEKDRKTLLLGAAVGGLAPLLFSFYLAWNLDYAGEWPLLFGLVACLDAAFVAMALWRIHPYLLLSGAFATSLTTIIWSSKGLGDASLWGGSLSILGLGLLFNLAPRLASKMAPPFEEPDQDLFEFSGIAAAAGVAVHAAILAGRGFGDPPWVFLVLLAGLFAMVCERGRSPRTGIAVSIAGTIALAVLTQFWFFKCTTPETLVRNLAVPLLLAVGASLASILRPKLSLFQPRVALLPADTPALAGEGGAVAAILIAGAGLFACLRWEGGLGGDPGPLFAALAGLLVLLVVATVRRDLTPLLLVGAAGAASFTTLWQMAYFQVPDLPVVLPFYSALYLVFLALPFVMPRSLAPTWHDRLWPWLTSALSGPLFFLAIYKAVVAGWGKGFIGAIPVLLAALSWMALADVKRRFVTILDDPQSRVRRLRYLALFAAVALGFISLAIPLQLDKQWITIGWALEAAAVWTLYRKLPHAGLKYFGFALFVAVGIRLLLNRQVLLYYERALPIFNWILYTYGIAALCCLAGASILRPVESERLTKGEREFFRSGKPVLASAVALLGIILIFALINLEIADYFSEGPNLEIRWEHRYDMDLTTSIAWGLYALALLVVGLWRRARTLRFISLAFMVVTVGKVFLYDLSSLTGMYRVLSFLGLAISLVIVSLLYQKFVFPAKAREGAAPP